jgi:hypothetical protein
MIIFEVEEIEIERAAVLVRSGQRCQDIYPFFFGFFLAAGQKGGNPAGERPALAVLRRGSLMAPPR